MEARLERVILRGFPSLFEGAYLQFGLMIEDGWFLLLFDLCQGLEAINSRRLGRGEAGVTIRIVKEKWGLLRVTCSLVDDEARALLREAEARSATICEWCGSKARLRRDHGWHRTLCDVHNTQYLQAQLEKHVPDPLLPQLKDKECDLAEWLEQEGFGPVDKFLLRVPLLHAGWEMDNVAWIVLMSDGTSHGFTTSHNYFVPWSVEDAAEKLYETTASQRAIEAAIALLAR